VTETEHRVCIMHCVFEVFCFFGDLGSLYVRKLEVFFVTETEHRMWTMHHVFESSSLY